MIARFTVTGQTAEDIRAAAAAEAARFFDGKPHNTSIDASCDEVLRADGAVIMRSYTADVTVTDR